MIFKLLKFLNCTFAQILNNLVIQLHDYLSPYYVECEYFDDTSFYATAMPLHHSFLQEDNARRCQASIDTYSPLSWESWSITFIGHCEE